MAVVPEKAKVTLELSEAQLGVWINEALQELGLGDGVVSQEEAELIAYQLWRSIYWQAFPDVGPMPKNEDTNG